MRLCNRNRKKAVLAGILMLALSMSMMAFTGCGDSGNNKINAFYISERELSGEREVERLYCFPNGTCRLEFTWGIFKGTYTWDKDNNQYVLDMAPGGIWPEEFYYAVKDGDNLRITGASVIEDLPFIYQGKAQ